MTLRGAACSVFLILATQAWAAELPADPELVRARQVLAEAHLAPDAASLLRFLRQRTLSEEQIEHLAATVDQLGDADFQVRTRASRKLVEAGPVAVPFLRAVRGDSDLELADRARRCLERIQQHSSASLLMAVARVLAEDPPGGATAALLAYLPCLDAPLVEEAWFAVLRHISITGGKADPALLAALTDRRAIRRAAAAHVLGRAAAASLRRRVMPLLEDSDVRVRYEAAAALVTGGESSAAPALIGLLADAPLALAYQAEQLLHELAGAGGPAVSLGRGEQDSRLECRQGWLAWWQANGPSADLSRLGKIPPVRGLTLICEYDTAPGTGGRVWECGPDGKMRWQVPSLQGANDVQLLPGGRILVAERYASRVSERDLSGKVLWEHPGGGSTIGCQRLANGNTLIITFSRLCVVTPEHREVFSYTHTAGFRHAHLLADGHILCMSGRGDLIELDEKGQKVRSIRPSSYAHGASYWASVEPLPGDRFLLALGGAGRVVEIDTAGKVLWECALPSPVFATRLRNGHTLVSCFESRCLVEVDHRGKEVSKQSLQGRPFTIRRY
jgi:hypothetical protein